MFPLFSLHSLIPKTKELTKELLSQHGELLLVEALTREGGELPAEDLGELAPSGPRWVTEERQVLRIIRKEEEEGSVGVVVVKTHLNKLF